MKRYLKSLIGKLGFKIERVRPVVALDPLSGDNMYNGLVRLRTIGLKPLTIVDVGAAEGTWTEKAATVWEEASFLLFEPLEERKEILDSLRTRLANDVVLAFAAAGKEESEVDFHITDDLDGSGIANGIGLPGNVRKVKLTSIDNEVAAKRLKPPFGIKLDTHGFEVPILEGAEKTLRDTVFVIIECYGFKIASGSLLFWEMCQYMSRRGFRLFDVVDTMRRPADRAFWQCDACFIRDNQPLFANNRYQ